MAEEKPTDTVLSGKGRGMPRWRYYDSRGNLHHGYLDSWSDKGGTDITYFFKDEITDELSLASGSILARADRIWE
jgi:hypothetical protein